ncbi:hypothetical protein GOODEAATRI_004316 [Goodea atripinnis]|uniref:Uncharacterized protein n=1 Tax=Goodea atripinnis TaxID=208336 RepID=A0ABV0MQE0_9TELE
MTVASNSIYRLFRSVSVDWFNNDLHKCDFFIISAEKVRSCGGVESATLLIVNLSRHLSLHCTSAWRLMQSSFSNEVVTMFALINAFGPHVAHKSATHCSVSTLDAVHSNHQGAVLFPHMEQKHFPSMRLNLY